MQVVLVTGGTGFTGRDSTPEAVGCLLDKQVDGFGELFRQISLADIGTSTMQSRALAGLANRHPGLLPAGLHQRLPHRWDGILADPAGCPAPAVQLRRPPAAAPACGTRG